MGERKKHGKRLRICIRMPEMPQKCRNQAICGGNLAFLSKVCYNDNGRLLTLIFQEMQNGKTKKNTLGPRRIGVRSCSAADSHSLFQL